MAGECAAGERDGLLIERRGDHGVGFAAHAELHGAANIGDGGEAVFGAKLAEGDGVIGGERAGFDERAGQRAGIDAANAARSIERGRIGDEKPLRERGDGLRSWRALRAISAPTPAGSPMLMAMRASLLMLGPRSAARISLNAVGAPKPPDLVTTMHPCAIAALHQCPREYPARSLPGG